MSRQIPGTIYLADQREATVTTFSRRYNTFGTQDQQPAHRPPFGALCEFNEETLIAAQRVTIRAERAGYVVVVPVTGALWVSGQIGSDDGIEVDVEAVLLLPITAHGTITFANPYPADNVKFLHLWVEGRSVMGPVGPRRFAFALKDLENRLLEILPGVANGGFRLPFSISLGRFDGRKELTYRLPHEGARFFAYVLAGAFEIEGRLLHASDALALWEAEEVEIEALSHQALLMVVEVKG
jgi:quercetin 2,3-dioxygenase